jgi:hypothetical protein
MSYSICNVLKEAGVDNIMRWVPFEIGETSLVDMLRNKMIRPTTIPHSLKSLVVEQAVAREALRLGLQHHKTIATRLKGAKKAERMLGDMLEYTMQATYIDMMGIGIIAGTGGLLSHAPLRVQSMLALTDAFQPEGVTKLYQDSVFMMPHLGVLSTAYPDIAWNVFDKDCLIRLGTVIAPTGVAKDGEPVMDVSIDLPDGETYEKEMNFGEIVKVPLPERAEAEATLHPRKDFDIGAGNNKPLETTVEGGIVGVILDARGRPLSLPSDAGERRDKVIGWYESLDVYPRSFLETCRG